MSYLLDLDEYSDEQIADEFARRLRLAIKGNCTYCLKLRALCACKQKNKPGMFHTAYWTETQGLVAEYVPEPKSHVVYYNDDGLIVAGLTSQVPPQTEASVEHLTANEFAKLQFQLGNKVKLPETEFFYQRFLKRSAEIKGTRVDLVITAEYAQEPRPYAVLYDEPKKVNDAEHPPTVG